MTEQELIRQITTIAAKTAIEEYRKEISRNEKETIDTLRHNTMKLFKHYNKLKTYVENSISDSSQAKDLWLDKLLGEMFDGDSKVMVKSIIRSKEQTELMMRHIDNMIDIYDERCKCRRVNYCDCVRRYYINGEQLKDIGNSLNPNVDERTVQRYIKRGLEEMSILLWGLTGIKNKLS